MIALNSDKDTLISQTSPQGLEPDAMINILASRSLPAIQEDVDPVVLPEHQPSTINLDEHSINQDRLELGLAPENEREASLDDAEIVESGVSDYADEEEEFAALLLDQDVEMIPYGATDSEPGSEEKVRVLISRYAQGHPLWHENDNSRVEGRNPEDEGRVPRKTSRKEPVAMSEEEKLLLWSSRLKKAKQEAALQDKRSSNSSLHTKIGKIQSRSDLQQPSRSRKDNLAVAKAVREPSRSGSSPRSSDWTSNGDFGQNPSQPTSRRTKNNQLALAVRPKTEQATAETPRAKVLPAHAPKDDIRQQYEMLAKAVASGGIAQSDLSSFIRNHGDKLSAAGIEA